jgi:VanZ family protein
MNRRSWALASGIVAVAIFVLSSIPAEELARTGIRIWDKAAHAGVWLALVYPLRRALGRRRGGTLLAIVLGVAYGVLDEVHQSFTPGRDTSGWDVLADSVGAIVGALLAARSRRL